MELRKLPLSTLRPAGGVTTACLSICYIESIIGMCGRHAHLTVARLCNAPGALCSGHQVKAWRVGTGTSA